MSADALSLLSKALHVEPADFFLDTPAKDPKSATRTKLNLLLKSVGEKKLKLVYDVAARILKDF